ncbi:MAG: radical SAM protein [bacterium]|nr:radical SAM protein [bacterium]
MAKEHFVIPIFLPQAGCPFQCIYCNQNKITGTDEEMPSPQEVAGRIESYLATIGDRAKDVLVAFYGGTFTGLPLEQQEQLLVTAKRFYERGIIQGIRISTKPDYISYDILSAIKDWGVTQIELGVQSLHDSVLKQAKRGYTASQVAVASKMIRKRGFVLGHQFMIGLPGDNWHRLIHTVQTSIQLKPDMVRVYPTLIMEGTALANLKGYSTLSLDEAIKRARFMVEFFEHHGVRILRVGLHPPADTKAIISGPYHPSFKSMVNSHIWGAFIEHIREQTGKIERLTVSDRVVSHVIGFQKQNLVSLLNETKIIAVKWLSENSVVAQSKSLTEVFDRQKFRSHYLTKTIADCQRETLNL